VATAGTPAAVPGPLRILVAIASPDDSSPVLDYERELRNVLTAVGAARDGSARVRVVPFATTAQIRAALEIEAVHVLHVSGHGSPGTLVIEHEDGRERVISADDLVDEAIPAGRMPAVIALAACYTNTADATGAPSFAARLAERGAAVVIASETSVTDIYVTKAFARIYGRLADAAEPDAVAAVADARRAVQAELQASSQTRERAIAGLGEWAVLSVLAGAGSVAILDPAVIKAPPPLPQRFAIGRVSARAVGEFVGRRRAQRRLPAELLAAGRAGVVLHGIGGIGKTTLAAELVTRVIEREPERQPVVLEGALGFESVLGAIVSALRRRFIVSNRFTGDAATALENAGRSDLPWADRLALLRMVPTVAAVPLLVVLDNFEDNLAALSDGAALRESTLAELLAAIVAEPGAWRLLVTSRYTFELPDDAARALTLHTVGALSAAETRKLIWSLPALDRQLDDLQVDQVWRMLGGHPRSLEYLDALLSDGGGRYLDIERRLEAALAKKLGPRAPDLLKTEWELDTALAEVATLAADDVLLDDLLASLESVPGARELLVGTSVYREPVDVNALLFQVGEPDDDAASIPDRSGAEQKIREILEAAGIPTDEPVALADLPAEIQAALTPHLRGLDRLPTPPRRPPDHLQEHVDACRASTLLSIETADADRLAFVHRWTASELERRLGEAGERDAIVTADRHAADYWRWRVDVWPQDRHADIHDLLEARHHLLAAGAPEVAGAITEGVCSQLHAWGAWEHEAELVRDTLARLPQDGERAASWIVQLGLIAYARGDLAEAETQYRRSLDVSRQGENWAAMAAAHGNLGNLAHVRGDVGEAEIQFRRAVDIYERLGNQAGVANIYMSLGLIASARGSTTEAETQYRHSLEIHERLGNQAGIAMGYHNLGSLAHRLGDHTEAKAYFRHSLDIYERLGNQACMATNYRGLGVLASELGDLAEAETQYRRSLDISERLGDQAGMSAAYENLGVLAARRGDVVEAETQFRRSLDITQRLGNQAGMATTYQNLGTLARDRGDLTEAETQYRHSLDINERLANQTGMAASISLLGVLAAERGQIEQAIGLLGRALLIRAGMGIPQAEIDERKLLELRPRVTGEVFLRALAAVVGNDQAGEIVRMLDELAGADGSGE
jgi:tetratricopeptide (TPR) repeat protein